MDDHVETEGEILARLNGVDARMEGIESRLDDTNEFLRALVVPASPRGDRMSKERPAFKQYRNPVTKHGTKTGKIVDIREDGQ